jgi:hypothetical protein
MGVGILRNGAEGLDYSLLMAHHEHKLKHGKKSESSHRIHSSNMIHQQHFSSAAHLSAMNSVLKNSNTGKANGAHGKIQCQAIGVFGSRVIRVVTGDRRDSALRQRACAQRGCAQRA